MTDTCFWCFSGFREGSTGRVRGMQRGLFTGGALCALELLSRPEATKSELPASVHSAWNGLSAEAQELLRAGAGHSAHEIRGGLPQLQPLPTDLQARGGGQGPRGVRAPRPGAASQLALPPSTGHTQE